MSIELDNGHILDPYKVLGVDPEASLNEIKKTYRKLVLSCHPDKFEDQSLRAKNQDKFGRIQQAWEIIEKLEDQREAAADRKRKEFLTFALEAYDARERFKRGRHNVEDVAIPSQPSQTNIDGDSPSFIEDEIKRRNRAFETLKGAGQVQSAGSLHDMPQKTTKKQTLYSVPDEQLNLQIMNPQQENILVDIVAVHGLGAIPDITWKERSTGINWLSHEDMLPSATPHARILRFGYDSLWMGKTPIRTSLSTIAYKLLLCLSMSRMGDLQRPLIFIGHCFGGLVIQRALNLAKMQQGAYPSVFDSTTGVVFLGTPHRGTQSFTQNSALLAAIAASSELSKHLERGILDSMTSEDGALLEVTDDFLYLCAESGPMITCFFEQRPSKLGKVVGRDDITEFIVDQKSATLSGHRKYGLELDHFSLNKFDGPDNASYIQVRAEILRFYREAVHEVDRKSELASNPSTIRDTAPPSSEISSKTAQLRNTTSPKRQDADRVSRHADTQLLDRKAGPRSRPQTVVHEDENNIRIEAMKELREEEANKQRVLYEKETQTRLLEEKRIAERHYLERLKRNMAKYGISNPDEIIAVYPLPDDEDLSLQEINDKDKWHKSLIKQELSAAGLDGGQIDEILHDTGEVMMIDDVETTFTKMAKKWISTRTLDKYNIPWQKDKVNLPFRERPLLTLR
jgi:curved DNA-binding protein CbpA